MKKIFVAFLGMFMLALSASAVEYEWSVPYDSQNVRYPVSQQMTKTTGSGYYGKTFNSVNRTGAEKITVINSGYYRPNYRPCHSNMHHNHYNIRSRR